jgi:imidazole glycerol-phosphate synthase subunit HisH
VTRAVIVDTGGANLASLRFALERLGVRAAISSDAATIEAAERVFLPGVGAAGDAMQRLTENGLVRLLPTLQQPVLGICLGMQLLFESSEEGPTRCLGVLPGAVRRLVPAPGRRVPHMGWNRIRSLREDALTTGVEASDYVYFVHGYAAPVERVTLAATSYGEQLSAVVRMRNFWGVQFHPERSGRAGARILRNFLRVAA